MNGTGVAPSEYEGVLRGVQSIIQWAENRSFSGNTLSLRVLQLVPVPMRPIDRCLEDMNSLTLTLPGEGCSYRVQALEGVRHGHIAPSCGVAERHHFPAHGQGLRANEENTETVLRP